LTTRAATEAHAGTGDVARARQLAEKLMAYDDSRETGALLQTHLKRAGAPELLD
jgi:hypothetical protein